VSVTPSDPFIVAERPAGPVLDKAGAVRRIQSETSASPLEVMLDLIRLARGPGRIQLTDYIRLRLFDRDLWQEKDRNEVVGEKQNRLIADLLNDDREWVAVLRNKVAAAAYLGAYGLPVVPTIALWQRGAAARLSGHVLADEADLVSFLRNEARYPLFGKPIDGLQSLGAVALEKLSGDKQSIAISTGGRISVETLANQIAKEFEEFIFQPRLSPHPDIAPLSAGHLATVRLLTLNMGDGARVLRACMKLNAAENAADNYWCPGNLLAQIDMASGALVAATTGLGFDLQTTEYHPDTGVPIPGVRIPLWTDIVNLGVAGAEVMRHVPLIGWDIGISAQGAVIVEMNETPDFLLPQLADRAGLLEPDLIDALRHRKGVVEVVGKRRLARLLAK